MKHIDDNIKYQPSRLFDAICKHRALKTDSELARLLGIGNAQICKVRHGVQPLSGQLLLRIHEVTGIDISQLKVLMGDRRSKQRPSRAKWTNCDTCRANGTKSAGQGRLLKGAAENDNALQSGDITERNRHDR